MSEPIPVPLLDLKAQYASIRPEIDAAVCRVIESQHFILGPEVKALEAEIAAYCGVKHAIGCASGSDALLLAMMALGVGPGDEVICPSFTFFATAGSVARLGARPVFVDIDPATYNLDPAGVRRSAARCARLKAIMPVHLYGQACSLDEILATGREHGVPVIEDAAQAIGTCDARGARVGSRGAIGCFSFFPSKNLGGFGDGGMLTTNDDALAAELASLRVHGESRMYYHARVGFNSRLDALQAAVLRVKLPHLESWSEARRRNAARYDAMFRAAGAHGSETPLADGGFPLRTPHALGGRARHIYNQYVIRVPAAIRDGLMDHLTRCGIGARVYYPLPLHMQECFAGLGCREGSLPECEAAAREVLALPVYPELTPAHVECVAGTVIDFIGQQAAPAGRTGRAAVAQA
jgi:dTDP-4-amino-4,6-dideoxygalactose transaminase